jgi:hypothetical protein
MPYEYLEHQADIGIRAWGRDYPEALAEAIRALAAVMVKPEGVKAVMELSVRAEAPSRDLLAVEHYRPRINAYLEQIPVSLWPAAHLDRRYRLCSLNPFSDRGQVHVQPFGVHTEHVIQQHKSQ